MQQSTLTIEDGQVPTPAAHLFSPLSRNGMDATWVDRSGGITVGYPTLTTRVTLPSAKSKLHKVRVKLMVPVLEVVSGTTYNGIVPAASKAFDLGFDGVFFLHERSVLANRRDLLAYVRNIFADMLLVDLVEGQETVT